MFRLLGILLFMLVFACGPMQSPPEEKREPAGEESATPEAIVEPDLPQEVQVPEEMLDDSFPEFQMGNIVFNTPDTMTFGETRGIQLLLSPTQTIAELEAQLQESGALRQRRIRISKVMEASLSGKGFKIDPLTTTLQFVNPKGVTEWRWEVTALESGQRKLYLTMNAILEVDGKELPHTIQTLHEVIEVRITWQQHVSGFVAENWKWLWTAIVVPFVGWLWERRKQRGKAKK